jgi:hypothetical protein
LALLANNKQAEAETGSVRSRAIDESLSRPKHATTQTNSSISLLKMTIAFSQGIFMELCIIILKRKMKIAATG